MGWATAMKGPWGLATSCRLQSIYTFFPDWENEAHVLQGMWLPHKEGHVLGTAEVVPAYHHMLPTVWASAMGMQHLPHGWGIGSLEWMVGLWSPHVPLGSLPSPPGLSKALWALIGRVTPLWSTLL